MAIASNILEQSCILSKRKDVFLSVLMCTCIYLYFDIGPSHVELYIPLCALIVKVKKRCMKMCTYVVMLYVAREFFGGKIFRRVNFLL